MTELERLEKELLQEIQEEPGIYANAEEFCTIDPETRTITVPLSKRILGTESDQETNRLYFKCPKVVGDNVDLSLFSLRINYQNAGNKKDQYLVEDVKEEGDTITFSWLLKRSVTAYKGNVKFILCAVKTTENGAIKNEWNTTLNTECESLEGMEVDKAAVEEETKDIVEQLIAMMNQSAENAVHAVEEAKAKVDKEVEDFALTAQKVLSDVNDAGQAQIERVQGVGDTAVESVKTAQETATEAIETAKTEAVQAVQAEGTTQKGKVTTEGTKQVQAVADKGKEVLQSIPEDFQVQMEAKLDKNQGAENAGKALVVGEDGNVIPGEAQEEGAPPIINSATGNLILVNDSAERRLKGLKVFGKSTQVTTTGAQLFNAREALASQIEKGTVLFDSDGKIILNGKFDSNNRQFNITLQPGTYTLSGDDNGIWHIIAKNDSVFRQTLVVDVETTYQCYIASNTYNNRVTTPMINIGDSAKPYEPYTGCKPAPSPEFPQEIKNSGNDGILEIKFSGKNILLTEADKFVSTGWLGTHTSIENGIRLIAKKGWLTTSTTFFESIEGKTVTLTCTYKQIANQTTSENSKNALSIFISDSMSGARKTVWYTDAPNTTETTISVTFTAKKCFGFYLSLSTENTDLTRTIDITNIQIELGDKATGYEPYKEQTVALTTPNGLPGIPVASGGNYTDAEGQQWICDEIDLQRGVYVQRIKKVNAKDLNWMYDANGDIKRFSSINISDIKKKGGLLSNRFIRANYASTGGSCSNEETGKLRVVIDSSIDTLDKAKQFFAENNTVFSYELLEPIETDLPPETIEAFKSIRTYYPTTTITGDGGELNPDVELSYVADTKNFILGQIAEIAKKQLATDALILERTV